MRLISAAGTPYSEHAEEVREEMAKLGFRSVDEMIGQADRLDVDRAMAHWKAKDLDKYRTTSAKWSDQLCHALWRSVLQKKDGTLIACAHTRYRDDKKGKARVVCYHSTDGGRTWGSESPVAYDPEVGGEARATPRAPAPDPQQVEGVSGRR